MLNSVNQSSQPSFPRSDVHYTGDLLSDIVTRDAKASALWSCKPYPVSYSFLRGVPLTIVGLSPWALASAIKELQIKFCAP